MAKPMTKRRVQRRTVRDLAVESRKKETVKGGAAILYQHCATGKHFK